MKIQFIENVELTLIKDIDLKKANAVVEKVKFKIGDILEPVEVDAEGVVIYIFEDMRKITNRFVGVPKNSYRIVDKD